MAEPNAPSPFYLCCCWALEKLRKHSKHLSGTDGHELVCMDQSIREWRQSTTLLPQIQLQPLLAPRLFLLWLNAGMLTVVGKLVSIHTAVSVSRRVRWCPSKAG